MAKKKSDKIRLECPECGRRNYTTHRPSDPKAPKLVLNKYCPQCRKHTPHKEVKEKKGKK